MPEIQTLEKLLCYHCGEECPDDSIHIAEKAFCCFGCKLVFELLSENNLCNYYEIEKSPGISRKDGSSGKKFEFLDDETLTAKLLDFKNEEYYKVTFFIPQIHCSSCIFLLENLYKLNPSIIHSAVNFPERKVSYTFLHGKISLKETVELLVRIGYEPKISLDDLENKKKNTFQKSIYYKVGIAGFAFGNIMLLSFPEYLAIDASSLALKTLFGYLIIFLSVPVFLYCSSEYFISAYKSIRFKAINIDVPLSIGIFAFYARSLYEILSKTGPGYMDSFAGLIFFLLLGRLFQNKTFELMNFDRDYKSYFPISINIRKQGKEESIPLSNVNIGDQIIIRNNEIIPVDSVLVQGTGNIDYSFITGESTCFEKKSGELIFAGGKHVGNLIELVVSKNVSQSYLTQLWNESSLSKELKKDILEFSTNVSRYFTAAILLIALLSGLYWLQFGWGPATQVVSAVLIIACPCALALSSPFALGNAMRILAKNNFYLKNTRIVEKLTKITAIILDKTGTLSYQEGGKIEFVGEPLSHIESEFVFALTSNSTHPSSRKIAAFLGRNRKHLIEQFREIEGAGIEGAFEDTRGKIGSRKYVLGDNASVDSENTGEEAAVPVSKVYVSINSIVKGYFAITGSYRTDIALLMDKLRAKYKVFILSGDNFTEMESLQKVAGKDVKILFNQSPFDKLQFVQELQRQNEVVMMIGDGLNDAGALQQSNLGISVSENIVNFTPASDGILQGDSLVKLGDFISFSENAILSIKMSFIVSLIYNIFGVYFAIIGQMTPIFAAILMPISSVTVIVLTVVLTSLFAKRRKFMI